MSASELTCGLWIIPIAEHVVESVSKLAINRSSWVNDLDLGVVVQVDVVAALVAEGEGQSLG